MAVRNETIERLVGELSPEGRGLWLEVERHGEGASDHTPDHTPEAVQKMIGHMESLSEPDRGVWEELLVEKISAMEAEEKRLEEAASEWRSIQRSW